MKKKRVLIVHNYYQVHGGEDTVVENEKNLLLDKGHKVILYTRHNNEIKSKSMFEKMLLPFESIYSIKTYRDIKKIIKYENIDIVHVHNTLPLISPSVYYAAIHCNIPVIQTIHNFRLLCPGATFVRSSKICEDCVENSLLSSVRYKCYRKSMLQSALLALTLKIHRILGTYNKVSGYIALTEFNKSKLKRIIKEEKIFVKPNFVKKNSELLRRENGSYFLFVGRIDELKGINLLIEAWKEINHSELLVAGTGPLEDYIDKYIKDNSIDNIKLIGFKTNKEIMDLISRAKALIVPSQWYEGFPMTIVESLSLGIPVIAGDIGNLSTIINDGENGLLFEYNNVEDLKRKINYIENNNSVLNKLRKGSIGVYNKNYNEDINYNLLLDIYNNFKGGSDE